MENIRNFCIIAHIDHGKSTLADRFLELTGTVEKRKMREQFLDAMELERELGITIKMQPVRMLWHPHRGMTQNNTQNSAETFLYGDLTYKIRSILFEVRKKMGLGHKEQIYHNILEIEFKKAGLKFESRKNITLLYDGEKIGTYQPDFVVEDKVLIELKALPEIGRPQIEQLWSYLKGCDYKLALLVNFGSKDLEIKRVVYDTARQSADHRRTNADLRGSLLRDSALSQRQSADQRRTNADLRGNFLRDSALSQRESAQVEYILNLIDTPGHVDFTYEVSRALAAVEGAILLVDGTQGIQAQTIANLALAKKESLVIIPAINKIDLPFCRTEDVKEELKMLLNCKDEDIFLVSGKTGDGVEALLKAVVEKIPSPQTGNRSSVTDNQPLRALIFDSQFDPYKGVIAHVRVVNGAARAGEKLKIPQTEAEFEVIETGTFEPTLIKREKLDAGEIGYIASGIKEPHKIRVGSTITAQAVRSVKFLKGYQEPVPVVFASVYPEDTDDYERFRDALRKLKLSDASLFFEPESSETLGRGFRMGFLGMLHLEITGERIRREFAIPLIFSAPSVSYKIKMPHAGDSFIYSAAKFPAIQKIAEIQEPWVKLTIISAEKHLGATMKLLEEIRGTHLKTDYLGHGRIEIEYEAPLKEIIMDFYDRLKGATEGYASMGYEIIGYRAGNLVKLDVMIAGKLRDEFSTIVPKERAYNEGRRITAKLKELLPRQLFPVSLQAAIAGDIIARETLPALKKDVAGYLYGGDRTRKMKLWKKQKRGKKRLKERGAGSVNIPPEVFIKLLKK